MSANLNRVFLMGNLTRDPELRYIPSGQAVLNFSLAVNRNYVAQSGEKKQETCFVRVVVWGRRAEVCNEYLRKGAPVFVEGRLQSRSWEAPDGTKRSTIEVVAESVQFLRTRPPGAAVGEAHMADEAVLEESVGMAKPSDSLAVSQEELKPDEEVPF